MGPAAGEVGTVVGAVADDGAVDGAAAFDVTALDGRLSTAANGVPSSSAARRRRLRSSS